MILIAGRADDPPIALTVEALQQLDHPYLFLELTSPGSDGLREDLLHVAGVELPTDRVRSVYVRPLASDDAATDDDTSEAAGRMGALLEWLDACPALVVSRPRAMLSNHSKPMQCQWIAEVGFKLPTTLVTNDPDDASRFLAEHGRVIYKSISGVRSIVREVDAEALRRWDRLRALPVQFQAWVPGTDVRVHVVGKRCFATGIHCQATDYRYARGDAEPTLEPLELPSPVQDRCRELARRLDLPLAGIDLRRPADGGDWVCFEVNPMPAFSYYEHHTGAPISMALAEMLAAA